MFWVSRAAWGGGGGADGGDAFIFPQPEGCQAGCPAAGCCTVRVLHDQSKLVYPGGRPEGPSQGPRRGGLSKSPVEPAHTCNLMWPVAAPETHCLTDLSWPSREHG